ncbi:MAG: ribonuclease R [Clostridia bacterium]
MEEKEKMILEFMQEENYIPMKAKEIAMLLEVPKKEYNDFMVCLSHLEKDFKIQKNKKGKYNLLDENQYLIGTFHGNEKGFGFVKLEKDKEEKGKQNEIYIAKSNTQKALNEDLVLVEIIEEDNGHNKEGRVVKIIKHEKNTLVGIFQDSRNYGFVVPDDRKFGSDIFISKKNFHGAKNRDKVVIEITKYPERDKKAEGKIIEVLGKIDEAGMDMLSLVKEYRLPYEFPEEVIKEAKAIQPLIDKKEIPHRLDLRQEEIFTIDGEDAKDLDDAVFVKKLSNGNYRLGVAIADVSHYVTESSQLDKEAILRGTSIYMLDRVIPMLPKELSNGICSLNAGEDRLALAVIMEINQEGKVISADIQKSVICVTKRMSYYQVSTILEYLKGEKQTEEQVKLAKKYEAYFSHFKAMEELAYILKKRREKQGSLNLDLPESKIILDQNGYAIDVKKYDFTFANEMIEQFMLTANETVAERFYWLEAPFIYRVHEIPEEDKVEELNKFLYNFGYKIKGSKENIHPKAFAEVLEAIKGKEEERVVSNLILRTLKVARYESQNKGHFGIASQYYCHFTSPIRRYPDLFIHRIITTYLEKDYQVKEEWKEGYEEKATKYAQQASKREKIAQKVERESINIKKAEYMEDKIGKTYEGIVSSITSFGMFVELENTVEGLIRFDKMGDEYFLYDENRKTLTGEKTKKTYKIGDKVSIRVIEANKQLRRIDFELI